LRRNSLAVARDGGRESAERPFQSKNDHAGAFTSTVRGESPEPAIVTS
jgi:hypothetical protein